MPAKAKKSARPADDFEDMLAEFRAEDLRNSTSSSSSSSSNSNSGSSSSSSSNSSRSSSGSTTTTTTITRTTTITNSNVTEDAMIQACKRNDLPQLRKWGRQGVRVKPKTWGLHWVANLDVLRCLVKELGLDVNEEMELGEEEEASMTLLLGAILRNDFSLAQCLCKELRADVNKANRNGFTPLIAAAENGNLHIVQFLAAQPGADVNVGDKVGNTALHQAVGNEHLAVVRCLAKDFNANVNAPNITGCTVLFRAVEKGNLEMVRLLIGELGANVNHADKAGLTPLMYAAFNKYEKVAKYLIKHGANPQTSSNDVGMAADVSKLYGAPTKQTAYFEAKTHCTNLDCSGAGLMKCTGCKQARYCGSQCQLAHWKAHKADCKRLSADLDARKDN